MGGVSLHFGKQNWSYISRSRGLVTEQAKLKAINSKSDAGWLLFCLYSLPLCLSVFLTQSHQALSSFIEV